MNIICPLRVFTFILACWRVFSLVPLFLGFQNDDINYSSEGKSKKAKPFGELSSFFFFFFFLF